MKKVSRIRTILTLSLAAIAAASAMPADAQSSIWKYTSTPCSTATYCPGWAPWEGNSQTRRIAVSDSGVLYNLTLSGQVWSAGPTTPNWTWISWSSDISYIAAGGGVYQLHENGQVDMWVSSTGWKKIDKRANIFQIAAGSGNEEVYEYLLNGEIWALTQVLGWVQVDNNPLSWSITAGQNRLFQLHSDGSIWEWNGNPCKNGACYGWELLDNNSQTGQIVADNYNNLYKMHTNGEIWKYLGYPGGWQKLDDNPLAFLFAAANGHLYQAHRDGSIWQYTGIPCTGNYCPGWQKLDDNTAFSFLAAGGDYLFQTHGIL